MKMYDYAHYLNEIEKANADTILFGLIGIASLMGAVLIIVLVTFLVSTIIKGSEDLRGSLRGSHSFFCSSCNINWFSYNIHNEWWF